MSSSIISKYYLFNFPIDRRLISIIPNFQNLRSLNVTIPKKIYSSQLQVLLTSAPHLYSLGFNSWATSAVPPYSCTSTSIRELYLRGYNEPRRQYCYDSKQCMELTRSPLAIQCRVLIIAVEKAESVLKLINSMINLRTLHIYYEHAIHSNTYDFIELVKSRLPANWTVTAFCYGSMFIQS